MCILVSLDTIPSAPELSAPALTNLAEDYDKLDQIMANGLTGMTGLETLRFANLYTHCLKINNVHCAAVPNHYNSDVLRALTVLGFDVVTNIQDNPELDRLALVCTILISVAGWH